MKNKVINGGTLFGRIFSHTLEKKVSAKGFEGIAGRINIATDDAGLNVISVEYPWIAPTYPAKNGKPERVNPNYAIAERLINSGKTILADSKDEATMVRLTPSLALNEWYDANGNLTKTQRAEGGFISVVQNLPEENERNMFEADILIVGTDFAEADEESGITESYLKVFAYIFNYAADLFPVEFVVKDPNGIKYFEGLGATKDEPVFTKVWGKMVSTTIKIKTEEEAAFGGSFVQEKPRSIKQWEIIKSAKNTYELDAEAGISIEEYNVKLAKRTADLKQKKTDAEERNAAKASGTVATPATKTTAPAAAGGFSW